MVTMVIQMTPAFHLGIRFSLKCLLPSYQPILCDSAAVSSFLSDEPIGADFAQTCASKIATMKEITDTAATIQIATEIVDPSSFQNTNPEFTNITKPELHSPQQNRSQFQFQSQEEEDELDERRYYRRLEDRNTEVAVHRPPPEPPDLKSLAVVDGEPDSAMVATEARMCRSNDLMAARIHNGAEDGAVAKGKVKDSGGRAVRVGLPLWPEDSADLSGGVERQRHEMPASSGAGATCKAEVAEQDQTRAEMVLRPPPKPPHQSSFTAVMSNPATVEILAVARPHRGAPPRSGVNNGSERSTEVGASEKEKRETLTTEVGAALRNGRAPFFRRITLTARPPPLMAAVLPWDREDERPRVYMFHG